MAELSNAPSCAWTPATLSGRWQITHKSNKMFGSEILRRCLLDGNGTVFVAFAGNGDGAEWDGCGGGGAGESEFLREFGSVFLLSAVYLRLSVIFLLKQEKQAINKMLCGNR